MVGVEAHFLNYLFLCGAMRKPVSCAEGLELGNSLIQNTVYQAQLITWKIKHMGVNFDQTTAGMIGKKYWDFLPPPRH
jgi:hypothetical protein